jgi:hypothetical protein
MNHIALQQEGAPTVPSAFIASSREWGHANHVIHVKSCHSSQIMSFMSNHEISCQIMPFISNHVTGYKLFFVPIFPATTRVQYAYLPCNALLYRTHNSIVTLIDTNVVIFLYFPVEEGADARFCLKHIWVNLLPCVPVSSYSRIGKTLALTSTFTSLDSILKVRKNNFCMRCLLKHE